MTQKELAERLNITDRAVSKWETGKAMPDSSIMLELCDILKINVNDMLHGEVVSMENYTKQQESVLLELVKQKEEADKRLLRLEIVVGALSVAILLSVTALTPYTSFSNVWKVAIIAVGVLLSIVGIAYAIKIEQTAGYYECANCRHRYVPSLNSVLWSMHIGRTRYMKCPRCGKRSWQKKFVGKQ